MVANKAGRAATNMATRARCNSTLIASLRDSGPLEVGMACTRTSWSMILSITTRATRQHLGAVSTALPMHTLTMMRLGM